MSLLDDVRDAVSTADDETKDLQATVQHEAWTGADQYGTPTFAAAVARRAIVDQQQHEHRTATGELVATQAYVAFIEPITPNGAAGRVEPIDPNDRITLPDGTTGPIVDVSGFVDAGTGRPLFSEVWLGRGGGNRGVQ